MEVREGEEKSKIIFLIDKNVTQCSISRWGSVVYCKNDGSVYYGGNKYIIGYPYSDICKEMIKINIDKKIKSCFCTDEDGFYLIDDEYGRYAFGYSVFGISSDDNCNTSTIPKKVQLSDSIKKIIGTTSYGRINTFISKNGNIYICGSGNNCNNFGNFISSDIGYYLPYKLELENVDNIYQAFNNDSKYDATTFIKFKDGTVKAFGINNGLIPVGHNNPLTEPTELKIKNVKDIYCSTTHTLFLLNDGIVKGCGSNSYGQLYGASILDDDYTYELSIKNIKPWNYADVSDNHYLLNDNKDFKYDNLNKIDTDINNLDNLYTDLDIVMKDINKYGKSCKIKKRVFHDTIYTSYN